MTVKQLMERLATCNENDIICLDLFMHDGDGHTEEISTTEEAIVSVVNTTENKVFITFEC